MMKFFICAIAFCSLALCSGHSLGSWDSRNGTLPSTQQAAAFSTQRPMTTKIPLYAIADAVVENITNVEDASAPGVLSSRRPGNFGGYSVPPSKDYRVSNEERIMEEFAQNYLELERKQWEENEVRSSQRSDREKRNLWLDNTITMFCILPAPNTLAYIDPVIEVYSSSSASSSASQGARYTDVPTAVNGLRSRKPATSAGTSNINYPRIVFITHGFTGDISNSWMHTMKDEILRYDSYQVVVLVGWKNGASPYHFTDPQNIYRLAAANTRVVGEWVGDIATGVHQQFPGTQFYGIGHSLGAHVMGNAGRHSGIFSRITGLDPAGPCFQVQNTGLRLRSSDATLVDVIHSDGYSNQRWYPGSHTHYGTLIPLGDIDFYPNWGGRGQPGCYWWNAGCSHQKAIDYYIWSVANPGRLETKRRITSQITYQHIDTTVPGEINGSPAEMGYHADCNEYTRTGNFYIETNSGAPYTTLNPHYIIIHATGNTQKVLTVATNGVTVSLEDRTWATTREEWYRDGQLIRNRYFNSKTLDFYVNDYLNTGWGPVYLNNVHKRDSQRFIGFVSQWERRGLVLYIRNDRGEIGNP